MSGIVVEHSDSGLDRVIDMDEHRYFELPFKQPTSWPDIRETSPLVGKVRGLVGLDVADELGIACAQSAVMIALLPERLGVEPRVAKGVHDIKRVASFWILVQMSRVCSFLCAQRECYCMHMYLSSSPSRVEDYVCIYSPTSRSRRMDRLWASILSRHRGLMRFQGPDVWLKTIRTGRTASQTRTNRPPAAMTGS